jgi:hypothetical protein
MTRDVHDKLRRLPRLFPTRLSIRVQRRGRIKETMFPDGDLAALHSAERTIGTIRIYDRRESRMHRESDHC